jgi:hypothetical protein
LKPKAHTSAFEKKCKTVWDPEPSAREKKTLTLVKPSGDPEKTKIVSIDRQYLVLPFGFTKQILPSEICLFFPAFG